MWYALLLTIGVVFWQSLAALSTGYILWNRAQETAERYRPWFNAARNAVIGVHLLALLGASGMLGSMGAIDALCIGWNAWFFLVVPRFVWLGMLAVDVAHQMFDPVTRLVVSRSYFVTIAFYCVVTFAALTLYDASAVKHGECAFQPSVELLVAALSVLSTGTLCCIVLWPARIARRELIRGELCVINGIPIERDMINWSGTAYIPEDFDALDRVAAARNARPATWPFEEVFRRRYQREPLRERYDDVHLEEIRSEGMPRGVSDALSEEQYRQARYFDPRGRRECALVVLMTLLFLLALTHGSRFAYHPVWRWFAIVLYCVPIAYWQWLSCIRPTLRILLCDQGFISGCQTLLPIEVAQIHYDLSLIDYENMLDYYLSCFYAAENVDKTRVDAFLRTYNDELRRDKWREFFFVVLALKRREAPGKSTRVAYSTFINSTFFMPMSPLNLALDAATMDVIQGSAYSPDEVELYDSAMIALLHRLEQGRDAELVRRTWNNYVQRQKELESAALRARDEDE